MTIYLDHNGTTPLLPEVRERFVELIDEGLGNPSSTHAAGRRARAVIDAAREEIAAAVNVPEEWVVFTSGGTEANNLALRGVLEAAGTGAGLAVSAIEHSAILEPARELATKGHELTVIPVDERGAQGLAATRKALERPGCRLLSVMVANNEVGSVAPMAEIGACLRDLGEARPLWHTDAVQALGKLPLHLQSWGVDLASFSAHKVGGPPGVGFLVRRPGLPLQPQVLGGGQESGLRAGTENAAAIGAAALAVRLACERQESYSTAVGKLVSTFWEGLSQVAPGARLMGPGLSVSPRLPNTINVLFDGVDGRTLMARLDLEGVEVSLGSACASGAIEPSHVLTAMGMKESDARNSLRLSLGPCTTQADINTAVEIMGKLLRPSTPGAKPAHG